MTSRRCSPQSLARPFAVGQKPRWLSTTRGAADFQQPFVTYDENTLIWAEAAYRTGNQAIALTKLNEEVEVPLIEVLADLEFIGMRIDPNRLAELSSRYGERLAQHVLAPQLPGCRMLRAA